MSWNGSDQTTNAAACGASPRPGGRATSTKPPKCATAPFAQTELVYKGHGLPEMKVLTDGETVWLTQAQMCELLGRERSVITKHVNNALREGEITTECNVQNLHIPRSDKPVKFYDLDVVISVGYRVKSLQGTLFRRWATRTLRELLLRRLSEVKNLNRLGRRLDKVESDVKQIKGGMQYLITQIAAPQDQPRRRIGFSVREDDAPTRPYGRSETSIK